MEGEGPPLKLKRDGTMSTTALVLYVLMMLTAFVTICVSGGFSIAAVNDASDAYDFVNQSCCRTGYEVPSSFSPSGSCVDAKQQILDTFVGSGKYHSVNLLTLEMVAKVFVWILWTIITIAFLGWIILTVKMRNMVTEIAYKDRSVDDIMKKDYKQWYVQRRILFVWTLVLAVAVGLIAIALVGMSYSFVSFQQWDMDFVVAGCCCCYAENSNVKTCNSGATCNSSTANCYNNERLKEHLGDGMESVADKLMPPAVKYDDWAYKAQATLITVFLASCFFIGTQLIAWFISKPTDSKVKLYTVNRTLVEIDIDQPNLQNRSFMYRTMRGGASMVAEEEQQHLRKRNAKNLSF